MTLQIVDQWQYCVYSIRSGVIRCTLLMVLHTWTVCASAGFTRCSGCTSVYLCAALLENLAGSQDFYSSLCVDLERSCSPRIRWCRTGGFPEQGQCFFIGLSCSIPTIVFYSFSFLFFLSIGWYCGALVFVLIGCIPLSLRLALPTFFNNNNNNSSNHRCRAQFKCAQTILGQSGQKARIVQIDFNAAFDRVNHQGILYRLSSVGIGGSVLSVY